MTTKNDDAPGWGDIYDPDDDAANEQPKETSGSGAIESLIAGSRINRGTVMDDPMQLTDEQRESIRKRCRAFRCAQAQRPKKERISNKRLAKEIAEKESTLSQVLADKYPRSKDGGAEAIDRVLRKVDQFIAKNEETSKAPKRAPFAWTTVAEDIRAVVNTTVVLRSIGVCYGSAGIGKTCTLKALLAEYAGSFLITITDDIRSITQLFAEIGDTIGVGHHLACRTTRKLLVNELEDSQRLCMVDEAHHASLEFLNALRQLQDECRFPMVLVGMPRLARNLMEVRGDDSMGATLDSRVQVILDLEDRLRSGGGGDPLYSMNDIRKVFSQSQLRIAPDAMRWLYDTANSPEDGGLRAAQSALLMAEYIATLPTSPQTNVIDRQALIDASSMLIRRKRTRRVERVETRERVAQ